MLWLLPESIQFLTARRPTGALEKINRVQRKLGCPPLDGLPPVTAQAARSRPGFADLFSGRMLAPTILVMLLNMSVMATVYFAISWTPKILSGLGFSDSIGIYASMMMNVAGVIGCLLFGLLANRFGLRNLSTAVFVGMGLALTAYGLAPPRAVALIAAIAILAALPIGKNGISMRDGRSRNRR